MSDRPSHQSPGTGRKFLPSVNPLESRVLLSEVLSFADGSRFAFPFFARLPRTGGIALQGGTALTVGVGQPTTNNFHATLDGEGDATVEWNGRPAHSFTGVDATLVQTGRARSDRLTFHLTNPRTGGTALASSQVMATPEVLAKPVAHPVHSVRFRTSGTAVQSGSVLTVTVTNPKTNTVEISSLNFGQVVQAEWNGGSVHDFMAVSTIIVVCRNGGKDLVGLDVQTVT